MGNSIDLVGFHPDYDFAVCCAVPIDAPGLTIVARPAGRPGEKVEHGEPLFSRKYGQSTGVCIFDRVFVPLDSVFYAAAQHLGTLGHLTYTYATHHRHTCIGARAGFGDLLIGAGALMCEANGFDPGKESHLREQMVELITITESFFACGVAASVYGKADEHSRNLHARPGVQQHRQAAAGHQDLRHAPHCALRERRPHRHPARPRRRPQPRDRRQTERSAARQPDVPYEQRIETARFIEDLTAGYQGGWYSVISLHGGGSPAAMKQEIYRNYPLATRSNWSNACWSAALRADGSPAAAPHDPHRAITQNRQPGKCCDTGCTTPGQPVMVRFAGGGGHAAVETRCF